MGIDRPAQKPNDSVSNSDAANASGLFSRVHGEHTLATHLKKPVSTSTPTDHLDIPPASYPVNQPRSAKAENLLDTTVHPELDRPGVASAQQTPNGLDITISAPVQQGEHVAFALPIAHVFKPDPQWASAHPDGPERGHLLHVSFKAKSDSASQMTAEIVGSKPPYPQWMEERVNLSAKGKPDANGFTTFSFDTVVPDTQNPGDLRFKFNLGTAQGAGHIQIKDISAKEVPSTATANPDALTNAYENNQIDRLRKGNLDISVVDRNGKPVSGAKIQINELSSQFMLGADANQLSPANVDVPPGLTGQAAQEFRLDNSLTHAQREDYLNKMEQMGINTVTIPIYWNQIEATQGKPNYKQLDQMIEEAKAHHMKIKLHPIVWAGCYPDWAGKTEAEAEPLIHKHIDDLVARYGNKVDYFEMNELNSTEMLQHQIRGADGKMETVQTTNGLTDWIKNDGASNVIETVDQWVRSDLRAQHSSAKLFENEYYIDQKTLNSDQRVAASLGPPDGFGIQLHMFEQDYPALKIEQMLNERGQTGTPDYVSEITVPSGPTEGRSVEAIAKGEAEQAQELAAIYREALANPHVMGVSLWDFTDKNAWRGGTGGVLNANLNPKPAFETLQHLLTQEYSTHETVDTAGNGSAQTRVFKGEYQITVTDSNGVTRTVDEEMTDSNNHFQISLPD